MVRIATACRYKGMTQEESARALTEWYQAQDTTLIKSTREEVMADIDRIVRWTNEEGFKRQGLSLNDIEVRITRDELLKALAQHSKAARKIYFAVSVGEKANCCAVSQN